MNELLPYYERELGFLRKYSREFSERYPKIAGHLLMAGDVCEDPNIERMIQSFALMNSRISKRLDDDYPEFTEALLEVLYPHYLKPFPSCSIVQFDYATSAGQISGSSVISKGTELKTKAIKGVACKFKTIYDVLVAPISLSSATYNAIPDAPEATVLPIKASSTISFTLQVDAQQANFKEINLGSVRTFIDGEPSFCAALRDVLFMRTIGAYVELDSSGRWQPLKDVPIKEVGFAEDDGLIEFDERSHPAYRLFAEYFTFPEKFNFFDLDLSQVNPLLFEKTREITVHIVLGELRADSDISRMLTTLSAKNVLLFCSPVINLFRQGGDPIRITQTTTSYPVLADSRRAYAYEIHSINSVKLLKQSPQGETVTEFRPFYSLRHGETADQSGHYWIAHRDEMMASKSPGYETEITLVDIDFNPAEVETQTLSTNLTCSNRDIPSHLSYGMPGGDLFLEGGSVVKTIQFLRKPTQSHRFQRGGGMHWRLISHLSMNHLSLSEGGVDAFKEILSLYDLPRSAISQRQINGIIALNSRPTQTWLKGNPFASLVRGTEVTMTIDEESFVGSGVHVFAHVVDYFLGLYTNANSFTQLVVESEKTGEELLRCLPRSGDLSLV